MDLEKCRIPGCCARDDRRGNEYGDGILGRSLDCSLDYARDDIARDDIARDDNEAGMMGMG